MRAIWKGAQICGFHSRPRRIFAMLRDFTTMRATRNDDVILSGARGWASSGGGSSKEFPCISDGADGRNRSVASWIKAKSGSHCGCSIFAIERVDPALASVVNADQSGTTNEGANA